MKKIVLAYSGSVASSAAIIWLAGRHGAEVVTVTLDVGQARELAAVRERALALGAVRAHVIDAREEFARGYLLPALQAGALAEGHALPLPLIARRLADVARMESADAVAHAGEPGAPGETIVHDILTALVAPLPVLAPARDGHLEAPEVMARARSLGVHFPPADALRLEASLWGRRVQAPAGHSVPEDLFTLTRAAGACPEHPAIVGIEFTAGVPLRANGVEMPMLELFESLETIAGAHGVGRRTEGAATIEAPAARVLEVAHRALASAVLGDDLAQLRAQLASVYADVIRDGRWFSDVREAIDAFSAIVQPRVTGTVRLELLKGTCEVVDCRPSPDLHLDSPTQAPRQVVA